MNERDFREWLRDHATPSCQRLPRPLVMGVLNITPDSFSDGSQFEDPQRAADHALEMESQGAELIDIGGESTRPGSSAVPENDQIHRIVPGIRLIRSQSAIALSVDTTRARVALAALDAGANLINDISAGRDDADMISLAIRRRVPIVLMHMNETPATMQRSPVYADVVSEVKAFLLERLEHVRTLHGEIADVLLDPGIGFGKTVAHNLQLLRRLSEFAELGRPLLVGSSRKSFIGAVTGETSATDREFGTAATVAWSVANGAGIVRVHDVKAMSRVVRMTRAILQQPL